MNTIHTHSLTLTHSHQHKHTLSLTHFLDASRIHMAHTHLVLSCIHINLFGIHPGFFCIHIGLFCIYLVSLLRVSKHTLLVIAYTQKRHYRLHTRKSDNTHMQKRPICMQKKACACMQSHGVCDSKRSVCLCLLDASTSYTAHIHGVSFADMKVSFAYI